MDVLTITNSNYFLALIKAKNLNYIKPSWALDTKGAGEIFKHERRVYWAPWREIIIWE